MAVADEYYKGAQRFRAECWMLALNGAMRGIIEHHRQRGRPPKTEIVGGMPYVVVEMASSWMQDLPGGKGARGTTGQTQYAEYRSRLHHSGLLFPRGGMVSPSAHALNPRARHDLSGEANRWAVPVHDLVTARDAVYAPWTLMRALTAVNEQGLARSGRAWTMDEVYHCFLLRRDGVPLRERYGYDCAKAISRLLAAVDPFLDGNTEPADDRDFTEAELLALDR